MKLLILDDDKVSCMMYEVYLKPFFEVFTVHDAESFLAYFGEHEADVVLVDVNIKNPKCTGIELAQLLKDDNKVGNTQFIALTAYERDTLFIPDWMAGYLQKPVDLPGLKDKLTDMMNAK